MGIEKRENGVTMVLRVHMTTQSSDKHDVPRLQQIFDDIHSFINKHILPPFLNICHSLVYFELKYDK
jgi:hypothetical protein